MTMFSRHKMKCECWTFIDHKSTRSFVIKFSFRLPHENSCSPLPNVTYLELARRLVVLSLELPNTTDPRSIIDVPVCSSILLSQFLRSVLEDEKEIANIVEKGQKMYIVMMGRFEVRSAKGLVWRRYSNEIWRAGKSSLLTFCRFTR